MNKPRPDRNPSDRIQDSYRSMERLITAFLIILPVALVAATAVILYAALH